MWLVNLLAHALPFYRASEDAGANQFNQQQMREYLEAWVVDRAVRDREGR